MNEVALAVLALAAVPAVVLLFLLHRSMTQLRQGLPDRAVIDHLGNESRALGESLEAQRRSIETLPQAVGHKVAEEVRAGLAPLQRTLKEVAERGADSLARISDGLGRNHDHLTLAVTTLNQEGALDEWVGGLRETIIPLQAVSTAVADHYQTGNQLLETTGSLLSQWAEQRDAVVRAFGDFSRMVERASAAETTHLRDIEHRMMNHLAQVAETNALLSHGLSELQTASTRSLESQENLATSIQETVLRIGEALDTHGRLQAHHQELLRAQEGLQKETARWQKVADQGLESLRQRLLDVSTATANLGQQVQQVTTETVQKVQALLAEAQRRQSRSLEELAALIKDTQAGQTAALAEQARAWGEIRSAVGSLPSRRLQGVGVGILVAQLVILGILVAKLVGLP